LAVVHVKAEGKELDIFRRLRQDHALQRDLANRIFETGKDTSRRSKLYRRFKREWEAHSRAETRVLYAVLMRRSDCRQEARRGLFAHEEISRQIDELDKLDTGSEEWLTRFSELREDLEYYTCEEEEFLFTSARASLHTMTASLMQHDYDARKSDLSWAV
jgi:hypothetical protein